MKNGFQADSNPQSSQSTFDRSTDDSPINSSCENKPRVCGYCKAEIRTNEQVRAFFKQIKWLGDTIKVNPEWVFAGIYADHIGRDDSPFAPRHPRLDKMLLDCGDCTEPERIDRVVTPSMSHIDRVVTPSMSHIDRVVTPSMSHFGDMLPTVLRTLTARGIAITFLKEGFDTATGDGEMLLSVLSSREEKELIRDKPIPIREPAPRDKTIGYRRDGKTLTVDNAEAAVVKRVFREYLAGNGIMKIIKIFEDEGIPTVTGRAIWSQKTIVEILRNERYCGERTTYGAEREALIVREDWQRVQALLQERINPPSGVRAPAKLHPYTGIAVCGYCGKSLVHAFVFGSGHWHKDVYICGAHHQRASRCPKARYYSEVCIGQLLEKARERYREMNPIPAEGNTLSNDSRFPDVKAAVFYGDKCEICFSDGAKVKFAIPCRLIWTIDE